ncbi:MAG: hypothetical protein JWN70_3155 [Planctomycetaceae bacterium]|nr:hypothetical protein [Planctomycetaceae bacterium]
MTRTLAGLLVALVLILTPQIALAVIEGEEGNENLRVGHRMPKGADRIINRLDRIAWWEADFGPFQAEGRGDTKAMNKILADFAKLDVKTKRVVVHDGVGQSYLINMNLHSEMIKAANIDWEFAVWPAKKWETSRRMFAGRDQPPREKPDLPAQIDVYTANIRWSEVVVPAGIEVIDERLEAHGFSAKDGIVLEGRIKKLPGREPTVYTVRVQRLGRKGEPDYTELAVTKSNAAGTWVLKNLPAAWLRVVVEAEHCVPRVVGYARCYDQPQWRSFDTALVRAVSVSGRVTDPSGVPLADVDVRLDDVVVEPNDDYESPTRFTFKTDVAGRFRSDQVPAGKARVWLYKTGYSMAGLGKSVTLPAGEIEMQLMKAGSIRVTVDFNGKKRPPEYMVEVEPEGGNAIGTYGGTATIDAKNVFVFENVPSGKYVVKGHPNPTSEREVTEALKIDLRDVKAADVTIKAK